MFYALLITLITLVTISFLQFRALKKAKNDVYSIFIAKSKDEPSEFAKAVDATLDYSIEKVTNSMKGSFAASLSHIKRHETALKRDLTAEHLNEENPMLGFLFGQLPKKWQNKVVDNPKAAIAALNVLKQRGGSAAAEGNGKGVDVNAWFK